MHTIKIMPTITLIKPIAISTISSNPSINAKRPNWYCC